MRMKKNSIGTFERPDQSTVEDPRKVPRALFLPYLIWENEKIIFHRLPRIIPYFTKSFVVAAIQAVRRVYSPKAGSVPDFEPVFILGHWRSGTTYLHKLMAADDRFCFVRLYDVLFPIAPMCVESWLKPMIQKILDWRKARHPHFYEHLLDLEEPSEEEAYLTSLGSPFSAYWGYFFPKRMIEYSFLFEPPENSHKRKSWKKEHARVLEKATPRTGTSLFLSKSPPNTCRIPILLEMYPNAKFIFVQRNPYHIYASMYRMLEEVTEKYYALQKINDEERKRIVISFFRLFMEKYEEDKKIIPEGHLIEVYYEDLMEKPVEQVLRIYEKIKLPVLGLREKDLRKRVDREKSYQPATHEFDQGTLNLINSNWSDLIEKWGYERI
jgi:hypothetical protein